MSQKLGRKGRKKWLHSLPQQHATRNEITEYFFACRDAGNPYVQENPAWLVEHIEKCKHCSLIYESICRENEDLLKNTRPPYFDSFMFE